MHFYRVYKYTQFPHRDPGIDQLIKEFDFISDALEFSYNYNTEKVRNANGDIVYHINKFGRRDYNYVHNGNDGYYVEEVERIPKSYIL